MDWLVLVIFTSAWVSMVIYQEAYLGLLCLAGVALLGFVVWFKARLSANQWNEERLYNYLVLDTATRLLVIEHLSEIYRQKVAQEQIIAFSEIEAVGVKSSGYGGILYLELANTRQLFLLKVEAEHIAQHLAHVMRRVIGLPEPERRYWW